MSINGMTGEEEDPNYQPQVDPKAPKPPGVGGSSQNPPPPPPPPAPSANVGHDGVYNGMNREQWRDAWMQDKGSLQDFAAAHGGTVNGDKVMTPFGEELDALIGHKAGLDIHGFTGSAGLVGANTGPGSGAPGSGAPGAAPSAGGPNDPNSFQGQIRAMLLAQMQKNSQPVDENDPSIKGELQSQDNALERTRRDRRAAMAERNAAEGLNSGGQGSGAFDADVASGFEDKGTQMSAVRSQLFARELTARRQTMNQQMQMALQTGDAELARALQLQISQADNQLRSLQLSQQQGQWNDQFGLQASNAMYQRDRDAALYAGGQ